MNKKFWAATFTLSGSIIGAGILGLPYVFSKSGFFVGIAWLIVLGTIVTYINLCLGEVTLKTKGNHQVTGYAKKYLGKRGEKIAFISIILGEYSALLAYLIGEGQSLSKIIPGNINPLFLGIAFWFVLTLLLHEGLRGLKKVETYGVMAIIIFILIIFTKFFPQINASNLTTFNSPDILVPMGVVMFALLGFTSIPEMKREIKGQEKKLKKAIILGSTIPITLYILLCTAFVGVAGKNINEIATISFSPIIILLGIITMFPSYFVKSFSLKDSLKYDKKVSKETNFLLTSIIPLTLYLIVTIFNYGSFSKVLGVGGIISGGLTGILILIMNKKSKNKRDKKPIYKMKISWTIIILLSVMFIIGTISEIINYIK